MAFSFGTKSPATTPGVSSSNSFGALASTPVGGSQQAFSTGAPSGGGIFGNSAALGSAPAPGGLFGTSAPASSSLFGSSPAPASGGFFGSAPAPASGGLFGSAPAPASGGLFANAGGGMFSAQQVPGPTQMAPPTISSQTQYSQLPPQVKQAIDAVHEQMMKHKRSVAQLQTMAPVLLRNPTKAADAAAGTTPPLLEQCQTMALTLHQIETNLQACGLEAARIKSKYERTLTQAMVYGVWPTEALASRRGIQLNPVETKSNPTVNDQIRQSLEIQAAHVDRLEKIPSPYMWQALEDMEERLQELRHKAQLVESHLTQMQQVRDMGVASVVIEQTEILVQVAQQINAIQYRVEEMRTRYRTWEKEKNVLDQQAIRDLQAKQKRDEVVQIGFLKAAAAMASSAPAPASGFGAGPAPVGGGGLFGSTTASSGGLFGSSVAPTAAPKPGGLFGSASTPSPGSLFGPTPAPAPGNLFGPTPAPAPGNLFGSTPAPAPGSLFSSTPAPGPSNLFSSNPAPTPGNLFGTTPAPGPTPGGLFGSAPAGGLVGGSPAPANVAAPAFGAAPGSFGTSTSKPKNKSRSSRRK